MRLPGFNASSSLYRTSSHYRIAVGGEKDLGTTGIPPLAASPFPSRPEVIQPFPHVLCQPCEVEQSGQCTRYCVFCPGPYPDERCTAAFLPCAASECCAPGQDPCYVSGKSQFCCPPGRSCCDPETNFCCPPGQSCCDPDNKVCCPPGQSCCYGVCCPPGQACFNGCCATNTGGLTLSSRSNYVLSNGCQDIQGLNVSLSIAQPMVAAVTPSDGGTPTPNGGFTMQLNAHNPSGPGTSWMQYIFLIHGNGAIDAQIQYWNMEAFYSCVSNCKQTCVNQGGNVSRCQAQCNCVNPQTQTVQLSQHILDLPSNTVPQDYVLEIALNYDPISDTNQNPGPNVNGATFTVYEYPGQSPPAGQQTIPVDSDKHFPIVAFQVDIGGPDNGSFSQFSSGAGTITYGISAGQLCVEGGLPDLCSNSSGSGTETAETSNAAYGTIGSPCCASQLTQSLAFPND
jgi:hypothetical protein